MEMVGCGLDRMAKPSRSDELLSEEEQLQLAAKVQKFFEEAQPKRPTKPERSDPTAFDGLHQLLPPYAAADAAIPEFIRFQDLQSHSLPLAVEGGVASGDDYEETEYYKELAVVEGGDHHTTGSGFIRVEVAGNDSWQMESDSVKMARKTQFRCNPATNEWEPSPDMIFAVSMKPPRSDP